MERGLNPLPQMVRQGFVTVPDLLGRLAILDDSGDHRIALTTVIEEFQRKLEEWPNAELVVKFYEDSADVGIEYLVLETPEEVRKRIESTQRTIEVCEKNERETYERLRAKFEGQS